MFSTTDHLLNATLLDDVLLNKMIVETEQLLSTFCYIRKYNCQGLYKPCFMKHPCQKWLQESKANALWLLKQLEFYLIEYKNRFNKDHKNIFNYLKRSLINNANHLEKPTKFNGCFGNSGCHDYISYYEWKKTNYKRLHKHTKYIKNNNHDNI